MPKKEFAELCAVVVIAIFAFIGIAMAVGLVMQMIWNHAIVEAITIARPINYSTALLLAVFATLFLNFPLGSRGSK